MAKKEKKPKRFQDYEIGESVWDGNVHVGRLEAKKSHPERPMGYILVYNTQGYTIFRLLKDAVCDLSLARNVPCDVMKFFAEIILNTDEYTLSENYKNENNDEKVSSVENSSVENSDESSFTENEDDKNLFSEHVSENYQYEINISKDKSVSCHFDFVC